VLAALLWQVRSACTASTASMQGSVQHVRGSGTLLRSDEPARGRAYGPHERGRTRMRLLQRRAKRSAACAASAAPSAPGAAAPALLWTLPCGPTPAAAAYATRASDSRPRATGELGPASASALAPDCAKTRFASPSRMRRRVIAVLAAAEPAAAGPACGGARSMSRSDACSA